MGRFKKVSVKGWSKEKWLAYRNQNGWGGSDAADVINMPEAHGSSLSKYLEKIGEKQPFKGNGRTRSGQAMEDFIRTRHECWDLNFPNIDVMHDNIDAGRKQRICIKDDAYLKHHKYPMFASLDARIHKKKILCEYKNTTKMNIRDYELGAHPTYYAQVQHNMFVTGYEAAHIFMQLDGWDYSCVVVEPDKEMQELLVETSVDLWERVTLARQIKEEFGIDSYYDHNIEYFTGIQREAVEQLIRLEPEVTPAEDNLSFVRDMFPAQGELVTMQGDEYLRDQVRKYVHHSDIVSEHNTYKDRHLNNALAYMGSDFNCAEFPEGKLTFRADKNGNRRPYLAPSIRKKVREGTF